MLPPVESRQAAFDWASRWSGRIPDRFEYLSGGYSNSNYLMVLDEDECGVRDEYGVRDECGVRDEYVVRFCDRFGGGDEFPGIDRERELTHIEHAGELTAELVHFELPAGHMVTRHVKGRHPLPDQRREEDLEASAALLKRVHALPRVSFHYDPFEVVLDYLERARRLGTRVPRPFERAAEEPWQSESTHFCHNDFNPWNLVLGATDAWVLDWEWSGTGDPFFDVAGVVVTHELTPEDADRFLELYLGQAADGTIKRRLARAMRLYWLREGGWALLQVACGNQRHEIAQQLAAAIEYLGGR